VGASASAFDQLDNGARVGDEVALRREAFDQARRDGLVG
jgi:hypothetical protein